MPAALGRLAPAKRASPRNGDPAPESSAGPGWRDSLFFSFSFLTCVLLCFCLFGLFLEKGKTELVSSQQRESCWEDTPGRDPARTEGRAGGHSSLPAAVPVVGGPEEQGLTARAAVRGGVTAVDRGRHRVLLVPCRGRGRELAPAAPCAGAAQALSRAPAAAPGIT